MGRGLGTRGNSLPRQSGRRRLQVEALEDRRLLAAMTPLPDTALDAAQHRASSLIVQFRDGATSPGSLAAHLSTGKVDDEWAIAPGFRRVDLDPAADWAATLLAYQKDPNVLYVQPDHRVSLELKPNDPQLPALYGLDNFGQAPFEVADADIDAPEAWDVTTGSNSVVVAVIDTGVDYNHPDLAANIWTNEGEIPGNKIDDDHNGFVDDIHGYDFVNNDGNPMDDHFHGTHVAGTIGAVGDNNIGVVGVNWHVSIMAVKFLDANGGGYESDAIAALNYAVANGAQISNNSWGGLGFSNAFQTALQNAANKGHIFVAASGNDGWNNDLDAFYPAGYNVDNVISVAATDYTDQLAWFSNYGVKSVDLAAPGVDIYSTFPTTMTGAMREGGFSTNYESISGTSMATPHVTGVMALVWSLHPEWSYNQVIEQVLGSVDLIDGAALTITGGRLNAAAAVGIAPADTVGPRLVSSDPADIVSGAVDHVRLRFNESIDASSFTNEDVIALTGPDGPIVEFSVAPVAGNTRQFDVTFAPQTTLGQYSLVFGPAISDQIGNALDQDRDGIGGEDPDDIITVAFEIADIVGYHSTDVPAPLEQFYTTSSYLTIDQDISITDLNLQLSISYPYDGDLTIYLESPQGTVVVLKLDDYTNLDADFRNTIFDDEANTPISFGYGPYEGSFQPEELLSAFDGENAAGTWKLSIDVFFWSWTYGFDDGYGSLDAWSLELEGDGGGGNPPPPPPPPPGNRAPVATDDQLAGEVNTRLAVPAAELVANDFDADGDQLSIAFVGSPVGGSVAIGADQLVTFTPDPDFDGIGSFQYIVTDGYLIDTGNVTIGFTAQFAFHNPVIPMDVDKDTSISPNDALTIINLLNAYGSTALYSLSSEGEPEYYVDVQADNYLSPGDALDVINYLNAFGSTTPMSSTMVAAEGEPAPHDFDMALLSLLAADCSKKSRG